MAGRGRGKTLPAWMTNGDTNVSASLPSTNGAPVMGQFSDARESQKVDTFQAQPGSGSLDISSMGRDHFQPQNMVNTQNSDESEKKKVSEVY